MDTEALRRQLDQIHRARRRWMLAYEEGVIDVDTLRQHLQRLEAQEQAISEELANLKLEGPVLDPEELARRLTGFHEAWGSASAGARKLLIQSVVEEVRLFPGYRVQIRPRVGHVQARLPAAGAALLG